jgi:hypothetical protein
METIASCQGRKRPLIKAMSGMESIPGWWLRLDHEEAAIFRSEFPTHALLKKNLVRAWLHGLKLEDALSVFNGIITRDAEEVVAEQRQSFGVVRGNPLFTPCPIFP